MSNENGAVVVGVDGSDQSEVIDFAATEAALRHRPLRVVHGFVWPYFNVPLGAPMFGPEEAGLRNEAERIVHEAVKHAHSSQPDIEVSGEVVVGTGAQALLSSSTNASLVVVGDRGMGAFAGIFVGSVAIQVAAHATCPVLVVRGTHNPSKPILLAVDGSPGSHGAVGFAFAQAAMRDVPLTALHIWPHPISSGPGDMQPFVYDEAVVADEETHVLAEALAGWRTQYPDVQVRQRVVHGRVRKSIIDATHDAQMVVLGARGRGGFTGLLLGSVSQAVLHHAACPTAIVSHGRRREPDHDQSTKPV